MVEYRPTTLKEALEILRDHDATIYTGGTDLMVTKNFKDEIIFVNHIEETQKIEKGEFLAIGAGCTYGQLIASDIPQIMKDVFIEVASPAIRNRGTVAGNICNASPAGDSLPMLYALRAKVELCRMDRDGGISSRLVPIEEFITGIRRLSKEPGELLTKICIPSENLDPSAVFYFKKVGARRAEAISKLSFFGRALVKDGRIADFSAAFGAVGVTVVSNRELDGRMIGLSKDELAAKTDEITAAYMEGVRPIDDQRSTAVYRKEVCENLFRDYLNEISVKL